MAVLIGLFFSALTPLRAQESYVSLEGYVRQAVTHKPLRYVNVMIRETRQGDVTDSNGYFRIAKIPAGEYRIVFSIIGYEKVTRRESLTESRQMIVALKEQPLLFEPIEITPATISVSPDEPSTHSLTPRQILYTANLYSRDIYRSLQILPGVSHSEWSSKPHIKGGNPDETAVIIDNLEIFEPFHLDELDGPFSLMSADLVDEMKILMGGFSARHPDKMSGVLRIKTVERLYNDSLRASVDFMGASVNLNQRIHDKMEVYTSGRTSYMYIIEKTTKADYPAEVYDLWTKINYHPNPFNRFSLNYFLLRDRVEYRQDSAYVRNEFFDSYKTNHYIWLNWKSLITEGYNILTTVGYQALSKQADFSFDASYSRNNRDHRQTKVLTLKQDHFFILNDQHTVEFGFEAHQFFSDYNYEEYRINPTETNAIALAMDVMKLDKQFREYQAGAYGQDLWRFTDRMSLSAGLRWSHQSFTKKHQLAPRLAWNFEASPEMEFKLAYGWYYQPDNFHKMRVYQNQYRLYRHPEKSIHYIGTVIYRFRQHTSATLDIYYKDYVRLNDDYNYDFFNRVSGIGIIDKPYFTKKGHSRGMDVFMTRQFENRSLLTLSYSFGIHRIVNYADHTARRDMDRSHNVTASFIQNLPGRITLGTTWRYHTGDPYTPSQVGIIGDSSVTESRIFYATGKKNSARLPDFHSLDFRIEKKWVSNQMGWSVYASVINAYNHANIRQYAWNRQVADMKITGFERSRQLYFKRFFLLGLSIELDMPRMTSDKGKTQ